MSSLPPRVLFGAAYYHEYTPAHEGSPSARREALERDLDLMAAASFSVIRVGESVWSTWEPEDGVFDLDWLQPVLDGAHARGISVILGTPTYAVPMWLVRRYPEIAGEARTGERLAWGARQEVDLTHPAFLFHAERVIRAIVGRYAGHPAVIGFQVDNEPGLVLLHNEGVFQRFVDHLRHTYGDVETLNREWGLVYWSHRLSTWADLWRPDGNAQPQYDLAWRAFQARLVTEFIGWQAGLVRSYAREGQFVTTCFSYDRPALADVDVAARLDVTAGNPYYRMQDHLALPSRERGVQTWNTRGTWTLHRSADRMYASRQEPFLVTETDATSIWGSHLNEPAYDGQWRQVAWALVSRGARMIEYWHWHTLRAGTETYWGGVLPHSGLPGRVYRQISELGAELDRAGGLVAGLTPDADVALLYDHRSKWALSFAPPLGEDAEPDPRSYETIVDAFQRGAFDAGLQTRVVHPGQLFDRPPADVAAELGVLVAAGFYITTDEQLGWLAEYAAAGGHLVVGIRTAYADHEGRARIEVQPARLSDAAGVRYDEYSNLGDAVPVAGASASFAVPAGATAERWADGLEVVADDVEVLVRYSHPHVARWPAVTTRAVGDGRITYVGTLPDLDLAPALLRWAVTADPAVGAAWYDAVAGVPSVTASSATAADGTRLVIVHNWSHDDVEVAVPEPVRDVLDDDARIGEALSLRPWDVRVLALA